MWKSSQFQRLGFTVLSVTVLLFSTMPEMSNAASNCSDEDREYAAYRSNDYDPEMAYKFGLTIKRLVADRDLAGLFELVRGELSWGPRKKFIENKTFDQVFTDDWRNAILESKPPCSPVGWRGFMLGNGKIWYRFSHYGNIYGINGAAEEEYFPEITDPAWRVDDRIIPPECFARVGSKGARGTGDHLITVLEDCPISQFFDSTQNTLSIDADYVSRERCTDESYCLSDSYRLLTPLSQVECQNLVDHLPGQCESAYLVETAEETGGSMGTIFHYNFYGLFNLEDGRKAIVPLVNFDEENDARNFLDDLKAGR